jgi:hypothetical protein
MAGALFPWFNRRWLGAQLISTTTAGIVTCGYRIGINHGIGAFSKVLATLGMVFFTGFGYVNGLGRSIQKQKKANEEEPGFQPLPLNGRLLHFECLEQ